MALPQSRTTADRFHPTEDFLDPLAHGLACYVTRLACGAVVDGAATPAPDVLGNVRRDSQLPAAAREASGVVALVTSDRVPPLALIVVKVHRV